MVLSAMFVSRHRIVRVDNGHELVRTSVGDEGGSVQEKVICPRFAGTVVQVAGIADVAINVEANAIRGVARQVFRGPIDLDKANSPMLATEMGWSFELSTETASMVMFTAGVSRTSRTSTSARNANQRTGGLSTGPNRAAGEQRQGRGRANGGMTYHASFWWPPATRTRRSDAGPVEET